MDSLDQEAGKNRKKHTGVQIFSMRVACVILTVTLLFVTGEAALVYSVSSLEDGNVLCTLTNSGENTEKFLKYSTPFESDIFGPILTIADALGRNAQYVGKVGRRVLPAPESAFLTLNAGESVSALVNVHEIYNVH